MRERDFTHFLYLQFLLSLPRNNGTHWLTVETVVGIAVHVVLTEKDIPRIIRTVSIQRRGRIAPEKPDEAKVAIVAIARSRQKNVSIAQRIRRKR